MSGGRSSTLVAALVGAGMGAMAAAQTFTTADPPVAIPDDTPTYAACQFIQVPPGMGTVVDVDVVASLSHTFIGDVTVRLSGPAAAANLTLFNRPGRLGGFPSGSGPGDDDDLVAAAPLPFDDDPDPFSAFASAEFMGAGCSGTIEVTAGCNFDVYTSFPDAADTPIPGEGSNLGQYVGAAATGTWTLCAADSALGETGTLTSWTLVLVTSGGCALTCPDSTVGALNDPGLCGAAVSFPQPVASGSCGPVTCSPPSGAFFPVGVSTATCSEPGGASCTVTVTVDDVEPPMPLDCPADVFASENPPGSGGATVVFAPPSAPDNCDGSLTASCNPPPGGVFPLGITETSCGLVDRAGNSAACTLDVSVGAAAADIPAAGSVGLGLLAATLAALGAWLARGRG